MHASQTIIDSKTSVNSKIMTVINLYIFLCRLAIQEKSVIMPTTYIT